MKLRDRFAALLRVLGLVWLARKVSGNRGGGQGEE